MSNILYANNAVGSLASGITNVAASLTLNSGQASLFPAPVPPQVFYVTLTDAATQTLIEIVQVTAVSGNVFSILRGQDGTTALSWNAGDIVSQRSIALEMRGWENAAEGLFSAQSVAVTPSTTLGIKGTTVADNANVGSVGEFISVSGVPFVSAQNTPVNLVSTPLSAGDWDVWGSGSFVSAGGAQPTNLTLGLNTTSATIGSLGSFNAYSITFNANGSNVLDTPMIRINVSGSTTIFLVGISAYSAGTVTVQGLIRARRVR